MKRLFRNIGICVSVAFLLVVLNSCGAFGVVFTLDDAKVQFIDWIEEQGMDEYTIGQYLAPVSTGDVVSSHDPAQLLQFATARDSGPLQENGWLFYADEFPGSMYSHPGKILVIGASGEVLYSEDTQGWPLVNGEKPASMNRTFQQMIADNTMTIYNPRDIWIPIQLIKWPGVLFRIVRFGAVVVNGLTPTQNLYTEASNVHDMMVKAMEDLFNDSDYVRSVDYPNNTPTHVANAIQDLVENEDINYIVLYYIAHGNIEYMNVGGTGFNASTLKTLFESYPNVNFLLFVESCHGGSWPDYFRDLPVRLGNVHMVIASTSRDKGAYPDWDSAYGLNDFNAADDVWVEFTSDFLLKMEYYTADENWDEVTGLDFPVFNNDTLRLFWLCYQNAQTESLILPARTGHQSPRIFYP